ncbi:MAG: mechanosensitive ion channel domain-containing protein [Pseudomonadota bacterium]
MFKLLRNVTRLKLSVEYREIDQMRSVVVLFLLLAPLAAVGQTADQPTGPIALEDTVTADAAIATRIRDILRELDGYENVTVTVSSGIVTLRGDILDTALTTELVELVGRVEGVVAIENNVQENTDVVDRLNPAVQRFVARMNQVIAFLPLALVALTVFVFIVMLGFWVTRWRRPWDQISPNLFIADIYRQVVRLLVIVGALVIALDIVGATALLSGILGAAGIVGLAIGFAVRDTVENFIASVMLSIRQPFRPNDTVEINGDIGKVIRLASRATILLSFDGNHIRIPNATVFKSRIVNFSRNPERRFTFSLTVSLQADLDAVRRLAEETINALPFVLDTPESAVWVESVDDFWVTMSMSAWINQKDTSIVLARSEALRLTQAAFDAAGFAAPPPTYRIEGAVAGGAQQAPSAKTASVRRAAIAASQDVDAQTDQALTRIVEEERAATAHEDLLDHRARAE